MKVVRDLNYDHIEFFVVEHSLCWIRFWDPPSLAGHAWRAEPVIVTEAIDVDEVLAWARSQRRLFELSVQAASFISNQAELTAWDKGVELSAQRPEQTE